MDAKYQLVVFLKFGEEAHMLDFILNGTIYMNPIDYFRRLEDCSMRGDNYEGVRQIWNFPSGKLSIPTINYEGNHLGIHLKESYEHIMGNIFSLYCVSSYGFPNPKDFYVDERIKQFGSHFVLIKDIPEFLIRIENKMKLTGYRYYSDLVEYYDKNEINRRQTVFHKPNEFEYQKEFRFYIDRGDMLPFIFRIGDLTRISELIETKHIGSLGLLSK
jgi:hypothetical protein